MTYSYEVARAIHQDRLHQAEKRRMLKQAEPVRAGLRAKVLIKVADLLITTGLRLKHQTRTRQPGLKFT